METHLSPDGNRLKENAEARLNKSIIKHSGQVKWERQIKVRKTDLKIKDEEKKILSSLPTNQVYQFHSLPLRQEKGDFF